MAERNAAHVLLQHMREVADIIGFGKGIPLENLVEALGWTASTVEQILFALRERGYVVQSVPIYGSGWWITGPGHNALETLEFFGY